MRSSMRQNLESRYIELVDFWQRCQWKSIQKGFLLAHCAGTWIILLNIIFKFILTSNYSIYKNLFWKHHRPKCKNPKCRTSGKNKRMLSKPCSGWRAVNIKEKTESNFFKLKKKKTSSKDTLKQMKSPGESIHNTYIWWRSYIQTIKTSLTT